MSNYLAKIVFKLFNVRKLFSDKYHENTHKADSMSNSEEKI